MNLFVEVAKDAANFNLLRMRALKSLHQLEGFGSFIGRHPLRKDHVECFLTELETFLQDRAQYDIGVSVVRYGRKNLYVCCAREEDHLTEAPYYISAFNCFPEEVCEGTGIKYWGS